MVSLVLLGGHGPLRGCRTWNTPIWRHGGGTLATPDQCRKVNVWLKQPNRAPTLGYRFTAPSRIERPIPSRWAGSGAIFSATRGAA